MMDASGRRRLAWLAVVALVLNAAFLGALSLLSFDPQRRAFGRTTGLWHQCAPSAGDGTGYEHWSPLLLLLLVPAISGLVFAAWIPKPASTGLRFVSGVLGLIAAVLVLLPTGGCIS